MPREFWKGHWRERCNRTACRRSGATWFHRGTNAYYCTECARLINRAYPDERPPLLAMGCPACLDGGELAVLRAGWITGTCEACGHQYGSPASSAPHAGSADAGREVTSA